MNALQFWIKKYMYRYGYISTLILLCVWTSLALYSFSSSDQSLFFHSTHAQTMHNFLGYAGASTAAFLLYLFGYSAFCIPLIFGLLLYAYIKQITLRHELDFIIGACGFFIFSSALFEVFDAYSFEFCYAGGRLGHALYGFTTRMGMDQLTQKIVWSVLWLASLNLLLRFSFVPFVRVCWFWTKKLFHRQSVVMRSLSYAMSGVYAATKVVAAQLQLWYAWYMAHVFGVQKQDVVPTKTQDDVFQELLQEMFAKPASKLENPDEKILLLEQAHKVEHPQPKFATKVEVEKVKNEPAEKKYALPKTDLFEIPADHAKGKEQKVQSLQEQAKSLEEKLRQFGIAGHVTSLHPGPVVTMFEYKPDNNIKLSRILALEDDLAMALQALSIRIIAPIPGKSVVGFEVANRHKENVLFADIIKSPAFTQSQAYLPMILGQDTQGNNSVVDLVKMPHLLVAGSTGSGKSVALNAMLTSMLCARTPDELKIILIDPKRLEFAAYEDIAHLLFPIIKDTQKAVPALKWVVKTMEDRYAIMAEHGVRNVVEYHKKQKEVADLEPMPFIVVIIDELADLMMTSGKAVEESIARIAQMARAAGIHLIVATQRPSVDVITGMIKVNLPNRISFKVTSKVDSRTILDESGAEKLLGRGDMLFLDSTQSHLVRLHGAYVSDTEIARVVSHIKAQQPVAYLDMTQYVMGQESLDMYEGDDLLYQEIVRFLDSVDEVSISMLQRQFRIGYNRSARIISLLESQGKILSMDGGKTRRVVKE